MLVFVDLDTGQLTASSLVLETVSVVISLFPINSIRLPSTEFWLAQSGSDTWNWGRERVEVKTSHRLITFNFYGPKIFLFSTPSGKVIVSLFSKMSCPKGKGMKTMCFCGWFFDLNSSLWFFWFGYWWALKSWKRNRADERKLDNKLPPLWG